MDSRLDSSLGGDELRDGSGVYGGVGRKCCTRWSVEPFAGRESIARGVSGGVMQDIIVGRVFVGEGHSTDGSTEDEERSPL